ncbi:MAG: cyclic nucleotide-binding domain-containing protein [Gammaproteobacteria bacterium]|nr:MAG: cyclic nucleotide-binding domain-containing protein [Gammaproteobacteria bacterium]
MPWTLNALLHHPDFPQYDAWVHERFAPGEYILRQGEPGRDVYLVLAGTVRVLGQIDVEAGRPVRPAYFDLGEHGIFGTLSLFDQASRSADVQAVSDCEVAVIDGRALTDFMERHPKLGYSILKQLFSHSAEQIRKNRKRVLSMLAWGLKAHRISHCL